MTSTAHAPAPRRRRREGRHRRSWGFWVGLGLVLGGLGLLGYVFYQYFVTDLIAERRHGEVKSELHDAWERGEDAVQTEYGLANAILTVPTWGKDYAVPILETTTTEVLRSGIGHYEDTVFPGQEGNFAIAAHGVTWGNPFTDLAELQPGDEVIVETRTNRFIYVVDSQLEVPFTETWVVDPIPHNPVQGGVEPPPDQTHLITMTTCRDAFHSDIRVVVFGHLSSVEPRNSR